jgi:hypothetical protein
MIVFLMAAAVAGPWIKEPGQVYAKLGTSRFGSNGYIGPDGTAVAGLRYVGLTEHLYAEAGVLPHLQVVGNLPFVGARNIDGELIFINRQLGDADLGLATGTKLGQVPVSLTASAKLPLYDNNDLASYGTAGAAFPAMGDGQVDLSVIGSVGTGLSVGGQRGWAAAEAGYRHRTEWWLGDSSSPDRIYGDGLPWRAQLGWSPVAGGRDLGWLAADVSGLKNLGEADTVTKQWVQAGAGLGARVGHGVALEAGAGVMPWARNSSTGWSVNGGISWSR